MAHSRTSIIFSISSDIGAALARHRLAQGRQVVGTCRKDSAQVKELEALGATVLSADFSSRPELSHQCDALRDRIEQWDELIVAPGTMEPIGLFQQLDFEAWAASIEVNFINQLFVVHRLLPARSVGARVVFFAGAATNGSADCFSAYAISKIALIKMVELLDSEMPDVCFSIVGPGWVNTKIHQETLRAGGRCEKAHHATLQHLEQDDFVSMEQVVDCTDWLGKQEKAAVGGRNISTQYDRWGHQKFADLLKQNPDHGKLRRSGNQELNGETEWLR